MTFVVAWVSGKKEITYRDQSSAEVTRKDGSRSWRNNNPGNIARGSFSEAHGSIGDDGKFGIFPDEQTGSAAIVALFTGGSYKNLSIRDAFYRYAPPGDNNDTEAYIAAVTAAVKVLPSTIVSSLSAAQLDELAGAIKVHEGWRVGTQTGGAATQHMVASAMSAGGTVQKLIDLGSDADSCQEIRAKARQAMVQIYGKPTSHNACACTLSLFLQSAGFGPAKIIFGAGALAQYLQQNGWPKVSVGNQQAGDVGVCRDDDKKTAGADHIFLVVKRVDSDQMWIADNQESFAPHLRFASGKGGKTPVDYFLRYASHSLLTTSVTDQAARLDEIVTSDEETDGLVVISTSKATLSSPTDASPGRFTDAR
ncbi:hypothetical protein [Mesorhizobium dulcispinae]|uniref:hypothetical protein n=1 Tax=Mesorhizobium dulcispinae TaxID=3072316 RepID=UPI002A24CA7B|nr:hypothetical protein [Mesorhizobium sp. VK23D]MDX8522072.1 hypothetical protein [Mesorhizobium sp. VK23D]